ncbi:peptide MFS transporter [Parasphingopyxis marina]|uniref:MFS transporter n=1 Tax=Parasphingopyxis marina TaxID=2761622 RepID=A0A842I0Y2_9SPHN|nr:peptide MFS transporter [Parasphingopyxis marina]MBC2778371.1 MFS transporter [Parasphingopyxis marina]
MATQFETTGKEGSEFLGHPTGLFVLFFAEMWERFSYYGMRALLTLYLVRHWMYSDSDAGLIYGSYTALVYITPVLGGYLADRYLGQRKAVLFGAVLLAFGHFCMAFEGGGGQNDPAINIFWLALAFIIVGSGFLKANISVIVGQLYPRTDVRRDGAYTIFYMGINLGAAIGALICGYLGETYGWKYGFGLAGIGMLLGLIVFVWGKPYLIGRGEPENPAKLEERVSGIKFEWLLYAIGVAAVALVWILIQYQSLVGFLLALFGVALIGAVLYYSMYVLNGGKWALDSFVKVATVIALGIVFVAFLLWAVGSISGSALGAFMEQPVPIGSFSLPLYGLFATIGCVGMLAVMGQQISTVTKEARDRIFAAMFLIFVSVIFWALFEQAGSSLNLFTDRHVDRGGVPASMFQSINAIYIILLAPIFAIVWTTLGRKGMEPSAPFKFGLGVIQVGLGFLVLVWGAQAAGIENATPVLFIFLIYLLHTTGELCLSPVGLSAMNRLAPSHMASIIMGTWFFASATGNFAAGLIASATGAEGLEGETAGKEVVLGVYGTVGMWAVGIGLGVLVLAPFIKRLMHLDTLKDDNVGDDMLGQAELGEPGAAGVNTSGEVRT